MFIFAESYFFSLTPITNIGASGDGAETTTFFAPPSMCACAFSSDRKIPVDSTTYSAPSAPHGISLGSRLIHSNHISTSTTTHIQYTGPRDQQYWDIKGPQNIPQWCLHTAVRAGLRLWRPWRTEKKWGPSQIFNYKKVHFHLNTLKYWVTKTEDC